MRTILVFISFLFCFTVNSQDTLAKVRKIRRHQVELSPASIWMNKGYFYGHRIKYQLQLKSNMRVELESNGTLFRSLDARASELQTDKVFPLLNQSLGVYAFDFYGKGKAIGRNKQKRYIATIRLGYHFFQHSTQKINSDYWAFDSTAQTGFNSIRSFQSHSISAGLGFRADKYKRKDGQMRQVAAHKWSLDYLGNVYYQLSSYSENEVNQHNIQNIPNIHGVQKSGARLNYIYTRYLNSYFGIHIGAEAVFVPFLKDYKTNSDYFVPRGNEGIWPLFANVNLGVSFVF